MVISGTVSIGASPTAILTAVGAMHVQVRAASTSLTWLGDGSVTSGNGFPIMQSGSGYLEGIELSLSDGTTLYGAGAGSSSVSFIATN